MDLAMRKPSSEEGQALVDYALLIMLVALVVIGALTAFGGVVQGLLQSVVDRFRSF
jgi:pilus assembly protein Flp/PilA